MVAYERFKEAFDLLSADEQRAVLQAVETSSRPSDVVAIVMAIDRTRGRRFSDRATDARRRVLVGARVPRELADKVKLAAQEKGVSVYRFVLDTISDAVR